MSHKKIMEEKERDVKIEKGKEKMGKKRGIKE